MIHSIKNHTYYFGTLALLICISGFLLIQYSKTDIHLFVNSIHHPFFDFFFKYMTYVGDGFAFVLLAIIALFISKRFSLQVVITGLLVGLISQFLKKVVYGPTPRPSAFFKKLDISLYYVDGVEMHTAFSFPSGHTTAIFAITTSILLIQKNKKYDLILLLIAILVGYSRMYLSQHFLLDVFAGSILGTLIAILVFSILHSNKMKLKTNLDLPLINFKTK